MASTGPLGDAPTVIGDLDQVQDLRPPPSAHIIDRLLSLRRNPKQGHFAALSKNEAQNIGGPVRNYGLHGRSEDIGQAYRSEKEAGIKSNYCFLCFRKGTKDYTIKVFFAWPIRNAVKVEETRLKSSATRPRGSTEGGEAVESRGLTGQAYTMKPRPNSFLECETSSADEGSQAEVMQAVQDALYQQQGWWKRWLWGYGIRSAQEIKVSHIWMLKVKTALTVKYVVPFRQYCRKRSGSHLCYYASGDGNSGCGSSHDRQCADECRLRPGRCMLGSATPHTRVPGQSGFWNSVRGRSDFRGRKPITWVPYATLA